MREFLRTHHKILSILFIIIIVCICCYCSLFATAYTKDYWVCETTGSFKTTKTWFYGLKSECVDITQLELFIKNKYPNGLQHNWKWSASAGYTIYGRAQEFSDGDQPAHMIKYVVNTDKFEALPDKYKKKLYDMFIYAKKLSVDKKKYIYATLSNMSDLELARFINNFNEEDFPMDDGVRGNSQ